MKRVQRYLGESASLIFFKLADNISYTSSNVRSIAIEDPPAILRSFFKSSIIVLYDEKQKVCMIDERVWHKPSKFYLKWVTLKSKVILKTLPEGAKLKISPSKKCIDVYVYLDSWMICVKGERKDES